MTKFKVSSYKDQNGRQRYTVHDVPIFSAVGRHQLEDGSYYDFDENYVRETFNTMKEFENIDEIRPAHENHWNFKQWEDGKIPSPDYNCPNFGKLVNFSLIEKNNEPFISTDITALTWKDLNDLENYAGRSPQILDPINKRKIDSLAFLKSMPPAKKGLGQIELDLTGVPEPEDEEEKKLSRKSSLDSKEFALSSIINFSETNKDSFRKFAIPYYVEEENVTDKEKDKTKAANFQDNPDDRKPEDDSLDFGDEGGDDAGGGDDTGNGQDMGGNGDGGGDMGGGDEPDTSNIKNPDIKEVAVILEDELDEKFEGILEKIDFMLKNVILELKQAAVGGGGGNGGGGQVMQSAPGGFSEPKKKQISAHFGEMKSNLDKIQDVQIKPNDEMVISRSKPVLSELLKQETEAVANFNKGNVDGLMANFSEINRIVKEALPDEVNPPNMTEGMKKHVNQKIAGSVPAHLQENPGIEEAWKEFCTCERIKDPDTGRTRCAANFREPTNIQDPKEAKKAKEKAFLTYYNTVYKQHKGITENTRILPIE